MIHISKGNSKIGKIPNISIRPILDCGNCSACKSKCYAMKAYRQYPGTRKAWDDNSEEFRKDPQAALNVIYDYTVKHDSPFFRIHVAGDFLNQNHLNAWVDFCTCNPATDFMVNTKMFALDYSNAPINMHIRFSMWPGQDIPDTRMPLSQDNEDNNTPMPKAWLNDGIETRIPKGTFECIGNCDKCLHCYHTNNDVVFKLH